MPSTASSTANGVSPRFTISGEDFVLEFITSVTKIDIDGPQPPMLGADGGSSFAMQLRQLWYPWLCEKLVEPKYDGVCQYLGMPSNKPSFIKDYHMISLFRAVDYLMSPVFLAHFEGRIDGPTPLPAPPENQQ